MTIQSITDAYLLQTITVEATPTPGEKVHLAVFDRPLGNVLFAFNLGTFGCMQVAEACAAALAGSDMPFLWVKTPNPNAAPIEA